MRHWAMLRCSLLMLIPHLVTLCQGIFDRVINLNYTRNEDKTSCMPSGDFVTLLASTALRLNIYAM